MSGSLFAGWTPDAAGCGRLARLVSTMQAAASATALHAKPRRPDQWHVTLCFIGHDVGEAVAAAAARALAPVAARIPPHAFRIERLAYWAGPGVIVALPARNPALQALCDACAAALRGAGIGPVQATTQPHITLAHAGRRLAPQPWLDEIVCAGEDFRVERFDLLHNPGGRYESLAHWPLTGTRLPPEPQQSSLL
jgi:2'-5' RNA ligase